MFQLENTWEDACSRHAQQTANHTDVVIMQNVLCYRQQFINRLLKMIVNI